MKTFLAVDEARAIIVEAVAPQPVERIAFHQALGRTLAEPVRSRDTIPPFDNSAMDGFAVRTADLAVLPARLSVIEEIPAGAAPARRVEAGTCARIMTGAPVPEGADAVVPVEWTEPGPDGTVVIRQAPAPGQHVRPAGEDVRVGDEMIAAGTVVTPPAIGMMATLGYAEVAVRVPPRVAVIATGDELVDVGAALGPGQIRDSNAPALAAQVRTAGGDPLPPLRARDDAHHIRSVIEQALAADVLLFSGGVSVGDYDLVKQVLDDLGMELLFWKVRQRPGKPLAFGRLGGKPVFGLPGNPVSSAMCFEQYVRPALATMLGRTEILRPRYPAVLDAPLAKKAGLHHFIRGIAAFGEDGRLHVRDTGPQGSNLYSSVLRANCLIHAPEPWEDPPAGTVVQIEWLTW